MARVRAHGAAAHFRAHQWTIADTSRMLSGADGKPDPSLIEALTRGYDQIWAKAGAKRIEAGRFPIEGLASWPYGKENHRVGGLPPEVLAKVDAWANEVLRQGREATGEDLVIGSVTLGKGFSVGGYEGPLIHTDATQTYLHGLTTLQGPSTLLFPTEQDLVGHLIIGHDPATGRLKVRSIEDREGANAFYIDAGVAAPLGQTVIISGVGYVKAGTNRQATRHASPPDAGMDRLTLFIDLQPRTVK